MDKYHLLFAGEVAEGQDIDMVKRRMCRLLDLEPGPKLERLFDGEPHILHHDLEREQVNEAFLALARMGAKPVIAEVVNVEPPTLPDMEEACGEEGYEEEQYEEEDSYPSVDTPSLPEVEVSDDAVASAPQLAQDPQVQEPTPALDPETHPEPVSTLVDTSAETIVSPAAESSASTQDTPNLFALRLSEKAQQDTESPLDQILSRRGIIPLMLGVLVAIALYLASSLIGEETQQPDLGGPRALQVDFAQNLYVAVGHHVIKHDPAGDVVGQYDLTAFGLTHADGGIAVFANGDLLIAGAGDAGRGLYRCEVLAETCQFVAADVPAAADWDFLRVDGNDAIYLTASAGERIFKFSGVAFQRFDSKPLYDNPHSAVLHRGLLYVPNRGEHTVAAALPDNIGFGTVLQRSALSNEAADAAGHTQVTGLARVGEFWWVLLQSQDGNSSGLYRYDDDWAYISAAVLPEGSIPDSVISWKGQLLVGDELGRTVHLVSDGGAPLGELGSDVVRELSAAPVRRAEWLPALRKTLLSVTILLLLALGCVMAIRHYRSKVYTPPGDPEEALLKADDPGITWMGAPASVRPRVKLMGYGLVAAFLLILVATRLGYLPGLLSLLLLVICMGLMAELVALYQGSFAFIGVIGDRLILVDPGNTYRVARTSRLQYFDNHLMIDDVIVSLGNKLQRLFDQSRIDELVLPLVNRGIRTDRITVHMKMIETRHPQVVARFCAAIGAVLAVLYLGVW